MTSNLQILKYIKDVRFLNTECRDPNKKKNLESNIHSAQYKLLQKVADVV